MNDTTRSSSEKANELELEISAAVLEVIKRHEGCTYIELQFALSSVALKWARYALLDDSFSGKKSTR